MPHHQRPYHHPDFRHVMAARFSPVAILSSLLFLIMAPSTGEGRTRYGIGEPTSNILFTDHAASRQSNDVGQSRVETLKKSGAGCYSCLYRGFLFPKEKCKIIDCDADMTCYKLTGFVDGAPPGSPPWVVHGCIQPSSIQIIREEKAECDVLKSVAEKLDPDGGPAPGTTFNRCAIHTCENYAVDLSENVCNDGRLGPLWCWQYAIEHDEDTIKASSKDFFSEQEYFRTSQLWLQNRRNATKCSESGLDSCMSISGWFRGRQWSVQTCADTIAVVEMLDKDESCAFLQDTLSNGKMGKNIIKFSQDSSPTQSPSSPTSTSSCAVRTCDTNGCNAQVPFFHLRQQPPSLSPSPSPSSVSTSIYSTPDGGGSDATDSPSTLVTRLSSSLVQSSTIPPSSSASHKLGPLKFLTASTWILLLTLVKDYSLICACTCVFLGFRVCS